MSTKSQGHLLTLFEVTQIQYFQTSFLQQPIEAKVHVELSWNGGIKCEFKWLRSHDQDGRHAHIL